MLKMGYAVDTATLYELWNDPRRIAGGSIVGLQGRLGLKPWDSGRVNLGFGQENLKYDLLGGAENHHRATGSLGLEQVLGGQTKLRFDADTAAAQNRIRLGFDYRSGTVGTLGVDLISIRGRDNAPNDSRVQISWMIPLERYASASAASPDSTSFHPGYTPSSSSDAAQRNPGTSAAWNNLLDRAAIRPSWMPSQVIAKLDTTAAPTRLIAIAKAGLPVGSSVNTATGVITTPLGVVVTTIASVTLNAAPFVNTGQFALSGNNLITDPNQITQPAVGVTDTYVVTINNFGGGTTLATIVVTHGSVKIDSIAISSGADTTPDAFTFVDQTNVARSTLTESAAITVAGINAAAAISVTGGEYQINGGAWTAAAGTVTNGQTVKLRHTSSAGDATATNTTLTIGGVSDTFTTTTLPAGYVSQGGLTWTPNTIGSATFGGDYNNLGIPGGYANWNTANTYCTTTTINGQTGWRLPTTAELSALYSSGAIAGQGWALNYTWSSTPLGAGSHEYVSLFIGGVIWVSDAGYGYVSCVR